MNTIQFFKTEQFATELSNEFDETTLSNLIQFGKKVLNEANDIIEGNLFTEYNYIPSHAKHKCELIETQFVDERVALTLLQRQIADGNKIAHDNLVRENTQFKKLKSGFKMAEKTF